MGALDIRQSSAQLKSLGQFRMPELDNGSAKAWEAHARAAQTAVDAAHKAGMATVEGISRRGQIVAKTFETLGNVGLKLTNLAIELSNRESERQADDAYLELKKRTTAELYGDENGKVGRLAEKPTDVRTWMQSIKDWNDQTVGELSENMDPMTRRRFQEKIASQQIGLQSTVAQHAANYTLAQEKTTAEAMSKDALDTAKLQFGNPALRDTAIQAYVDAKNHEYDVLGVPDEARAPLMRSAMRDLVSGGWDATITNWSAEISAEQDPEKVKEAWAAKKAEAEKAGYTLNCAAISSHMPDGLTDAEKAMYKRRIDDAEKRSVGLAYQRQSEKWKAARNESIQKEIELLKSPLPTTDEGKAAYYTKLAADYTKLAENPSLSPTDRLSYTQMASRLEATEARHSDAVKDANYRQLNRNVSLDCRPSQTGDSSSFVPYSYADQKADVDRAFAEGRITTEQWNDLATRVNAKMVKKAEENEDTFAVDLLNAAAAKYPSMRPRSIKYNKHTNSVYFDPAASTKQHKITAESRISGLTNVWGAEDEEEDATYDQLVKVVQSTLLMRRNLGNKMSVAEALEQIDREFGPTARGRAARNAAEKINGIEASSLAW